MSLFATQCAVEEGDFPSFSLGPFILWVSSLFALGLLNYITEHTLKPWLERYSESSLGSRIAMLEYSLQETTELDTKPWKEIEGNE